MLTLLTTVLFCSVSFADSQISIDKLKTAIETELNVTDVTFRKAVLDKLKDRYLAWGSQLEFQFLRYGNPLTAKCKLKNTEVGLYMKCKTYDQKGKASALFDQGEISNLSKVISGVIPIIPNEKTNEGQQQQQLDPKRSGSDRAS